MTLWEQMLQCLGHLWFRSAQKRRAYSLFFIVGTLGAIQIPVVGLQPLRSLEALAANSKCSIGCNPYHAVLTNGVWNPEFSIIELLTCNIGHLDILDRLGPGTDGTSTGVRGLPGR